MAGIGSGLSGEWVPDRGPAEPWSRRMRKLRRLKPVASISEPAPTGRTGSTPGRRAPAVDQLRETREKLAQGTDIKPEFEHELLSMFVRNELGATLTIPLLAIIIALASMFWAPPGEAMLWVGAVFLARSMQMSVCYGFSSASRTGIDIKRWKASLIGVEAVYGVAWAGVVLITLALLMLAEAGAEPQSTP